MFERVSVLWFISSQCNYYRNCSNYKTTIVEYSRMTDVLSLWWYFVYCMLNRMCQNSAVWSTMLLGPKDLHLAGDFWPYGQTVGLVTQGHRFVLSEWTTAVPSTLNTQNGDALEQGTKLQIAPMLLKQMAAHCLWCVSAVWVHAHDSLLLLWVHYGWVKLKSMGQNTWPSHHIHFTVELLP